MNALQMDCSGLPHAFPRKIQSAAFNGSSYILLDTQNQAAIQYGQDFQLKEWTPLGKKYTAVCYDEAEACYWAIESYNADTIFRLDLEWNIAGKIRVENVSQRFASGIGVEATGTHIWVSFLDGIAYLEKESLTAAPVFQDPCCKDARCRAVLSLPGCMLCVCSMDCREYVCVCHPYFCKNKCLCIPKDCGFAGICHSTGSVSEENGGQRHRFLVFITNYYSGELYACQCSVRYRLSPAGLPCDFELESNGCLEDGCCIEVAFPPAVPCCGTSEVCGDPAHCCEPVCCEPCRPEHCCEPVCCEPCRPEHCCEPVCCEPCHPEHCCEPVCCEPCRPEPCCGPVCCEPCRPEHCCEPVCCEPCRPEHCCNPCGCCNPCRCESCCESCGGSGCGGHCGCAKCQVIESVALQEAGLAHILNAEGEKIQKAVAQSKTTEELLAVNESVRRIIIHVTQLEMQLYIKLEAMVCEDNRKHPCWEDGACSECLPTVLE